PFLKHLRAALAQTLDDRRYILDSAVLAVSPALEPEALSRLRQAVTEAGLDVAAVLSEPFAAVAYYAWASDHGDATYLVAAFDRTCCSAGVVRRQHDELTSQTGCAIDPGEDGAAPARVVACCQNVLQETGVALATI